MHDFYLFNLLTPERLFDIFDSQERWHSVQCHSIKFNKTLYAAHDCRADRYLIIKSWLYSTLQ